MGVYVRMQSTLVETSLRRSRGIPGGSRGARKGRGIDRCAGSCFRSEEYGAVSHSLGRPAPAGGSGGHSWTGLGLVLEHPSWNRHQRTRTTYTRRSALPTVERTVSNGTCTDAIARTPHQTAALAHTPDHPVLAATLPDTGTRGTRSRFPHVLAGARSQGHGQMGRMTYARDCERDHSLHGQTHRALHAFAFLPPPPPFSRLSLAAHKLYCTQDTCKTPSSSWSGGQTPARRS